MDRAEDLLANAGGASMGPRSDNRGMASASPRKRPTALALQWVHGRITVVMGTASALGIGSSTLQWVHGRITVVMQGLGGQMNLSMAASMGPRSDNRGYGGPRRRPRAAAAGFNGSTVG